MAGKVATAPHQANVCAPTKWGAHRWCLQKSLTSYSTSRKSKHKIVFAYSLQRWDIQGWQLSTRLLWPPRVHGLWCDSWDADEFCPQETESVKERDKNQRLVRESAPKYLSQRHRKITCNPALAERETAFALAFPESLPAFPPAWNCRASGKID